MIKIAIRYVSHKIPAAPKAEPIPEIVQTYLKEHKVYVKDFERYWDILRIEDSSPFASKLTKPTTNKIFPSDDIKQFLSMKYSRYHSALVFDSKTREINQRINIGSDKNFVAFCNLLAQCNSNSDFSRLAILGWENQVLYHERNALFSYAQVLTEIDIGLTGALYFKAADDLDHHMASYNLSLLLKCYSDEFSRMSGHPKSDILSVSFEFMEKSCKFNIQQAKANLALMLLNGIGIPSKRPDLALEMLRNNEDPYSKLILANLYFTGLPDLISKDTLNAFKIWNSLAVAENEPEISSKASYNLGNCYFIGVKEANVNVNYALAHDFWKFSFDKDYNNHVSALHLGNLYFEGLGVGKNYDTALHYYEICSEVNDDVGRLASTLAEICREHLNISQDILQEPETPPTIDSFLKSSVKVEKTSLFKKLFFPRRNDMESQYVGGMKNLDLKKKAKQDALCYRWKYIETFQSVNSN